MSLQYVTRHNSTPHGKPKVYFCCHPDDFEPFFSDISKDILDKQDCSIWFYSKAAAQPNDGFLDDLSQMQLFVFPVTLKLLCTENFAMDIAFPYAQSHNIPILPLIQEGGLEEIYAQKFGSLQFLDKHVQDSTALSYGEKLEKYLDSILIGNELAAKIRAAFDAYIFLSYRKKDRKYALELMRLIHKNPLYQDIGIWFDEFLIPGENFNEVIKNSLSKSDLFLLAVTPNLINEPNYIMDIEYPLAKEGRKPILPAELVPTDHEGLSEKYEGIPSCVDAYCDEALSAALLDSIKRLAIRENDASPEHKFFIGLAYLGGIDVEVDFKKAFALIASAAESGLTEAMQKLSEMYHDGHGVTQNYVQAVNWRRKVAEHFANIYHVTPSRESANRYISALFKLVVYEFDCDTDAFLEASTQIIDMLTKTADIYSEDIRESLAVCYSNLGYYYLVSIPLWRFDLAEKNYLEAAKLYKQLADEQKAYLPKLATTYQHLGKAYYWLNKFEQSKEMYRDALNILFNVDPMGSHDYDYQISAIYSELAALYRRNKVFDQAEWAYKHSISILCKLKQATHRNVDEYMVLLYKDIATMFLQLNRKVDAEKYLLDALSLAEGIASQMAFEYANRQYNAVLKESLTHKAKNISSIIERLQEAYEYEPVERKIALEQRAVNFFARMAQIIPAVYNPMYGTHGHKLAELLRDAERFTEAEQSYLLAISIFEKCIPDNRSYHFSIAESYNNLAVMYHDNEHYDKAEDTYRKALSVRQYCARELSGKYADEVLALSYMNLGILLYDTKRYIESKQMYLLAIDFYTKVQKYYSVAKLHVRLGDLYRAMKQPLESASQFHAAIDLCERMEATDPEGFVPILADAHDGLSFLYKKEGNSALSAKETTAAKEAAMRYPTHFICKRILNKILN